jgi:membrane-bound metal-dependent hydrolase YbcI (DUF457 family)
MEPINHVLFALIPVLAYSVLRYRRLPGGAIVLVAVFAGLFADLVDKPLAWTFGVIPSGRVFTHSILIATPLLVGVLLVAWRSNRLPYGAVFAWGHLSHIAGDFYPILTRGTDYYWYPNFFWPYMDANPDRNPGFGNHLPAFGFDMIVEFAVLGLILTYVVVDIRHKLRQRAHPS